MKRIHKYFFVILISTFLLYTAFLMMPTETTPPISFQVQSLDVAEAEELSIFDAENGNYYVFLPSYTKMDQVYITLSKNDHVSLGHISLSNEMDCGNFNCETPYEFVVNGQQIGSLWFYKSANVATMYIDTASGSMGALHKNKNHQENISMMLYTANGTLDFCDDLATLKGRGNSSWSYDKRPYSLTLSNDGNLLGMGSATTWVLLANAYDETNLNNKLIFDLASRVGLPGSPDSRWVDLYLNGEYAGLYLLTEKIEIHDNRLPIKTNSADFLCKVDFSSRWDSLHNPFLTASGRTVDILSPKVLTEATQRHVELLVNQMEQIILSGTDLGTQPTIDLESWIYRYLIDEISGNVDADLASSYFYYTDHVFYAGPVWDYDLAFGNMDRNQAANSFIAKNKYKSSTLLSPYYHALYTNESFYRSMVDIYRTKFVPILQELIDTKIIDLSNFISQASQSNSLRWRPMFDEYQNWFPDTVCTPEDLLAYLSQRFHFLNSVWLEDTEYCTLQFESIPGDFYWNVSIPKGTFLETAHVDLQTTVWIDSLTGKVFDFTQPVLEDAILIRQTVLSTEPGNQHDTSDYITLLSISLLLILLLGFVIIDIVRRK